MASGLTGTEVPGNRLRVRVPCPPLRLWRQAAASLAASRWVYWRQAKLFGWHDKSVVRTALGGTRGSEKIFLPGWVYRRQAKLFGWVGSWSSGFKTLTLAGFWGRLLENILSA